MRKLATALTAAMLTAGCAAPVASPTREHGNREAVTPRTIGCGIERWAVKTGTDPAAAKISLATITGTTIAQLAAIPPPPYLPPATRIPPVETTVYRLHATLREFKTEADSDIHLVLDNGTSHMIAEIPDPACVSPSSPFLPGITTARSQFTTRYTPSDVWQQSGQPVTVTGTGYFDSLHGQTGVAVNGIELHPVLSVTFGS
jgi:hypothetical protein